tara:strand:- start:1407 stop:1616 length:210 start_codon:yes stop_codon:yes gene_type:complete
MGFPAGPMPDLLVICGQVGGWPWGIECVNGWCAVPIKYGPRDGSVEGFHINAHRFIMNRHGKGMTGVTD